MLLEVVHRDILNIYCTLASEKIKIIYLENPDEDPWISDLPDWRGWESGEFSGAEGTSWISVGVLKNERPTNIWKQFNEWHKKQETCILSK